MRKIIGLILSALLCFMHFIPVYAEKPQISSASAIVIDAESGQILYEKNKDLKVFPASTTKVMTVYLASRALNPDDITVGTKTAIDAVPKDSTNIAIDYGEELTAEQAMYAAMLMSANDACNVLAEKVSGSIEEFVKLMNTTAQSFGAENTRFANSNGLPDDNHYTTAHDMAKITRKIVLEPKFMTYFTAYDYQIPPTNKNDEPRNFVHKHRMTWLDKYEYLGVTGGKTGYTKVARHTAVTYSEKDGKKLVSAVFGAEDLGILYQENEAILKYAYTHFTPATINSAEIAEKVQGEKKQGNYRFTPTGTTKLYLPEGVIADNLEYRMEIFKNDTARVLITDADGNVLGKLATERTEIVPKFVRFLLNVGKWLLIVAVAVLFIRIVMVSHIKRKRRKARLKRRREQIMKQEDLIKK